MTPADELEPEVPMTVMVYVPGVVPVVPVVPPDLVPVPPQPAIAVSTTPNTRSAPMLFRHDRCRGIRMNRKMPASDMPVAVRHGIPFLPG